MATPKKIDIDKFWTDPAHAEEKDFLCGVFDKWSEEKQKKASEEAAKNAAKNPPKSEGPLSFLGID